MTCQTAASFREIHKQAKDAVAQGPSDAWPIIFFCAVGAMMSIYMAVSYVGINAVPGVNEPIPGG